MKEECECGCSGDMGQDCECPKGCKDCNCNSVKESYFDKFMDSILISEKRPLQLKDSPIRKRIERHQDRPGNKTVWGVKMKIDSGRSLQSFLDTVIKKSVKNLHERRQLFSEDQLNVPGNDKDALEKGDVDSKIIIDKLNTIRAGKSFKDSIVNSQMEKYISGLSKEEKTALFAFVKAIAQIVTGEISADNVVDPSDPPADLSIKKGGDSEGGGEGKVVINKVSVKTGDEKSGKPDKEEDTSGPTPIKAK